MLPGKNEVLNLLLFTLLSALVLAAGCTSEEARSVADVSASLEEGASPPAGDFNVDVTLSRKLSKKSGRPIGAGDVFQVTAKSYVNALVDFSNVKQERPYVVHLVWVRPDGKKLFMKYVDVRQSLSDEGRHQTVVSWLDATDLHDVDRDTIFSDLPEFSLDTRLNISTRKNRVPGKYSFQVYLDRRLLMEEGFLVEGDHPSEL